MTDRPGGRSRVVIATLAVLLISILATGVYVRQELAATVARETLFEVNRGSNLFKVTTSLVDSGLLATDITVFKAAALLTRRDGTIKAGQYRLTETMTALDVLSLFRSGRVAQHRVTFPEGWTLTQWLGALAEAPWLEQTAFTGSRDRLAASLGISGDPEGWFFPDTYQYVKGDGDIDVLRAAHERMKAVLEEEWRARAHTITLATPYELLTLASVIEKETGLESDRPLIASVFHNRLQRDMRLQSDPTIIYGLGDSFDGDLKRSHLRTDSPYNTYTRKGLPPTPICAPGRRSISAAAAGSMHPFLYFVARGDGSSEFSVTLEEHNQAVNRFQLNRSQNRE